MSMKKICALLLCCVMLFTLAGCKSKAVKEVEGLISAIGEVTAESEAAVSAAEAAYEALSEKDRAEVENYQLLADARPALESAKAVKGVEDLIEAIGEVTAESEAAIQAAETAFEALSEQERAAVQNHQALLDARPALEAAKLAALVGTWTYDCDVGTMLYGSLDGLVSELGMSIYNYDLDYNVQMDLTFNEDGTYAFRANQDSKTEATDKLHENAMHFIRDLVFYSTVKAVKDQGLSGAEMTSWDDLAKVLGMGEDDFFQFAYGMGKEDYTEEFFRQTGLHEFVDQLGMEGKFQVKDGKLFLTTKDGQDFSDDRTVSYEIEADVMQWKDGTLDLEIPLGYTMIFRKNG